MNKFLHWAASVSFISLLLVSCDSGSGGKPSMLEEINVTWKIDVDPLAAVYCKTSDLIDSNSIELIPLKTDSVNVLGRIDKVRFRNGKIVVADFNVSNSIFVFDSAGNFLNRIGNVGHGPGEYSRLSDFELNDSGIVLLADERRCEFYSLQGVFLREFSTSFYSFKFAAMPGNKYLFCPCYRENLNYFKSNDNFNFILTNSNGCVLSYGFPYNLNNINSETIPASESIASGQIIRGKNNYIAVGMMGNDTIYAGDKTGLFPFFALNFVNKKLPDTFFLSKGNFASKTFVYQNSATVDPQFFYSYDSLLAINYCYQNSLLAAVYNAKTGKTLNIRGLEIDCKGIPIQLPFLASDNDKIVSEFNMSTLYGIVYGKLGGYVKNVETDARIDYLLKTFTKNEFVITKFSLKS
jgi:hypothetical protein